MKAKPENDSRTFYARLAPTYDRMTRAQARFERELELWRSWKEILPVSSAVDLACGTGLHAQVLSSLGIDVVGVDLSLSMLQQAQASATERQLNMGWIQAKLERLPLRTAAFDLAVCLGNSLPHLLSESELQMALLEAHRILKRGGNLLLQLLNYEKILMEQERIVGVRRNGNTEFIRFYDFLDDGLIRFNVLQVREDKSNLQHELASTVLRAYRYEDLHPILEHTGFQVTDIFGNLKRDSYSPASSANLVVLARKP